MALPMSLCPDNKRGLNFYILKKNQNTTMLDKGGCAVFSTSSSFLPADSVSDKQSKFPVCLPPPSFHTRTFNSFVVGGFLGSKSQGRSTNSPQSVWDIIPNLFHAATECLQQHCNLQHCSFSSVPSPPKKKFAQGENLAYISCLDTSEFPVIKDKTCEESRVENSKQSYADVAKAVTSKPSRSEICKVSKGSIDVGSRKDHIKSSSRKDNTSRRRTDTADHRSSRRKTNKREKRESSSRKLLFGSIPSPSSESQPPEEPLKDLRLCQQEKHFSRLQLAASNRNPKRSDRHCSSSTNPDKRDRLHSDHTEGKHPPKKRSNYRNHCDKRGNRAKQFDCDIDKINWRTGEPISSKMGLQNDVNGEDYLADQSCNSSFTCEQTNEASTVEQRKPEITSETSWHDLPSASPRCRRRSLSECSIGSEDSFIVFQSGGAPSDSLSDEGSDWSDCDSDDSFQSDSEMSDEDDMCDGLYPSSSRLAEVNEHWQKEYAAVPDSSHSYRKVCFSNSKPTIHRMLAWDFAYRTCRPGPWEEMARDRERFRARIRQYEPILSSVLTSEHRNKLWKRFHTS